MKLLPLLTLLPLTIGTPALAGLDGEYHSNPTADQLEMACKTTQQLIATKGTVPQWSFYQKHEMRTLRHNKKYADKVEFKMVIGSNVYSGSYVELNTDGTHDFGSCYNQKVIAPLGKEESYTQYGCGILGRCGTNTQRELWKMEEGKLVHYRQFSPTTSIRRTVWN